MGRVLGLIVFLFVGSCATGGRFVDTGPFPGRTDLMVQLDEVLASANQSDKMALVVLGANWCHDSKGFVENLTSPDGQAIQEQYFEVALLNVGYLERGFDVADRLGITIYTHTPTVLMVDPASGQVMNGDSHYIWRDAAAMSAEETAIQLEAAATAIPSAREGSEAHQMIDAFEAAQAKRLVRAYDLIGPRLARRAADLNAYWRPVAKMRYAYGEDVVALRRQANDALVRGDMTFIPTLPTYPAFPWEDDETPGQS